MWLKRKTPSPKLIMRLSSLYLILMMALLACEQTVNNEIGETKITEPQPAICNGNNCWAFEETFESYPKRPSQRLLPRTFDYVVTHRSHPESHFTANFGPYPADHGTDCGARGGHNHAGHGGHHSSSNEHHAESTTGFDSSSQHQVISSHLTHGNRPDKSFFICNGHMMSSLGDVSPYSVSSFWPKQEFDFSSGGVLEFDVNINDRDRRSWFEVMITPREQLKVAAARLDLPVDETYPADHIVMVFGFVEADSSRFIQVGKDRLAPEGLYVEAKDPRTWRNIAPDDPALTDRRIRRTMRIRLENNRITWEVEKQDGSFDPFVVDVPGGLPFNKGLVVFKTHAYTPVKDGNTDAYTFHWDNIRFSGPVTGKYKTFKAPRKSGVVYLQQNGDREIGESQEVRIRLAATGPNPVLFGQVHSPQQGQVLLSINGAAPLAVSPYDYEDSPGCYTDGWNSFRLELDPSQLKVGANTFNWIIGERPACSNNRYYPWDSQNPIATGSGFYPWNGFSVKNLEVQMDE